MEGRSGYDFPARRSNRASAASDRRRPSRDLPQPLDQPPRGAHALVLEVDVDEHVQLEGSIDQRVDLARQLLDLGVATVWPAARSASIKSMICPLAGVGATDSAISLPAILSSIAARTRCFSSSTKAAGS
jgi:hypothetical protein